MSAAATDHRPQTSSPSGRSRAGGLLPSSLAWCLVTVKEIRRMRLLQAILVLFAAALALAGGLKGDGTELGRAQVVLKVFERGIAFSSIFSAAVLAAYLIPYEEIQRNRILLTASWPLRREAMMAGTAAGIILCVGSAAAAMYVLLGLRLETLAGEETLARLSGRVRIPVGKVLGPDGTPVKEVTAPNGVQRPGAAAFSGGEEVKVVFRRPEGPAFVAFGLYAGGRHHITGRIFFEGTGGPRRPEFIPLNKRREVPVPEAPPGAEMTLVIENLSPATRVSLPAAETELLVRETGMWGNLARAFLTRVLAAGYVALVGVGLSGFMGFPSALAVTLALTVGAYLAPFVSGLLQLPRFTSGRVEIERSWNLVIAAGNVFGDLLHVGPGERLPLGAAIPGASIRLGLLMLLRGGVFFVMGAFLFKRREVGA